MSGGAPAAESGGHSRARRTPSPAVPAAPSPPPPTIQPDPAASELGGLAGLAAQLLPGPGLRPPAFLGPIRPRGQLPGCSGLAVPGEG